MFSITLVKPIYVISLRSKIDLIPIELRYEPPTDKYSILVLTFLSLAITAVASLSPEVSPVKMNIFFILF